MQRRVDRVKAWCLDLELCGVEHGNAPLEPSSLLRAVGAAALAEILRDLFLNTLLLVERLLSGSEQPGTTQQNERDHTSISTGQQGRVTTQRGRACKAKAATVQRECARWRQEAAYTGSSAVPMAAMPATGATQLGASTAP
jgi:hypothetical protein